MLHVVGSSKKASPHSCVTGCHAWQLPQFCRATAFLQHLSNMDVHVADPTVTLICTTGDIPSGTGHA